MESNKEVARRIYEEVLNKRNLDLLDEIMRPDYIEHDPLPGQRTGIEGTKDRFGMLIKALDPQFTIDDVIAEGEKVVVRWTNTGTHVGELFGIPPTGRSYSHPGIDIYRLQQGKLAEHWHVIDLFGQMVQLGVITPPGGGQP